MVSTRISSLSSTNEAYMQLLRSLKETHIPVFLSSVMIEFIICLINSTTGRSDFCFFGDQVHVSYHKDDYEMFHM